MPLPRLVALDLDGTLLTSAGVVTERSRRAIGALRDRGVRVVLCTGRPPRYVAALAHELDLADLAVVYNGAATVNFATGAVDYRHELGRDLALEVIERVTAAHPEAMTGLETHHGWYLDERLYALRLPILQARDLAPPDGYGKIRSFVRDRVVKVLFRHPERASHELARALGELPVYTTWSHSSLLEVMAARVNKREALETLCARFGLRAEEVAAFGDQRNDREMLAWAGCGVAVANAAPEARAAADRVTRSNDEDGVAEVLEAWLSE